MPDMHFIGSRIFDTITNSEVTPIPKIPEVYFEEHTVIIEGPLVHKELKMRLRLGLGFV